MSFKKFMLGLGMVCLAAVIVFSWGCQNQPTGPKAVNSLNNPGMKFRSYQSGTHDGYFWSLWKSDGLSGSVNYSNGSDGNYSVSWNCNGNFTCGKGWSSGSKNRVVSYNCGQYSHSGGGGSFAYYGWTRNPLMEYYVNEKWPSSHRPANGSSLRTVSSDGGTYNVYTAWRSNAPSIDGTQSFRQIFSTRTSQSSTGENHTITFANHANAWSAAGYGLGSDMNVAAILLTEAWGQSSGSVNATVWEGSGGGGGGGGSSSTTTTQGSSSTTTYSGGSGSNTVTVRARGTGGGEHIYITVDDNTIGDFNLTTSYQNYSASTNNTGGINVCFDNDDGENMDVQIDYITVNGETRQAEDQSYNTGVWQNDECGGGDGHSEMLHCEGCIGFGDVSGGGGGGGSTSTTTTSGGYTTTTTSGGGGGGGSNTIVVRARGTGGGEHIYVTVDDNQIADFNLTTSYSNYTASTNNSGGINVCFDNDDGENMDVQIDYITVNGETRQAEDQSYNTGVWQNDECGGGDGMSEMLHCEGCIGFGDVSGGGGGGGATTTAASTTTSGSSWWGGGSWYGSTTTSGGATTTTAAATTTTSSSSWWGGGSWW
jgi:hypothetical protein